MGSFVSARGKHCPPPSAAASGIFVTTSSGGLSSTYSPRIRSPSRRQITARDRTRSTQLNTTHYLGVHPLFRPTLPLSHHSKDKPAMGETHDGSSTTWPVHSESIAISRHVQTLIIGIAEQSRYASPEPRQPDSMLSDKRSTSSSPHPLVPSYGPRPSSRAGKRSQNSNLP